MVTVTAVEFRETDVEIRFSDGTSALLTNDLLADIVRTYLAGQGPVVVPKHVLN